MEDTFLPCDADITEAMDEDVPARALKITMDKRRPRLILKETLAAGVSLANDMEKVSALLVDDEPCVVLLRFSEGVASTHRNTAWVLLTWSVGEDSPLHKSRSSLIAAMPKHALSEFLVKAREDLTVDAVLAKGNEGKEGLGLSHASRISAQQLRKPVVAALSGSARNGSLNTKLLVQAIKMLEAVGATVRTLDLEGYNLPVYDVELEQPPEAFPEGAKKLKEDLKAVDAFLIASPEYNGFITPLILNSITWATRGEGGMYDAFRGKVAVSISASPGPAGGSRAAFPLRDLIVGCGCAMLPDTVAIGGAMKAFREDGSMADAKQEGHLKHAMEQLMHYSRGDANRQQVDQIMNEVISSVQRPESSDLDVPAMLPNEYGAIDMPETA